MVCVFWRPGDWGGWFGNVLWNGIEKYGFCAASLMYSHFPMQNKAIDVVYELKGTSIFLVGKHY